jgi:hypothetical protein
LEGLRNKAAWVLKEMERRIEVLEFGWDDTTASRLYTVHDIRPLLAAEIAGRGSMVNGLTWHYARPPVAETEYEMDCRGVNVERILYV